MISNNLSLSWSPPSFYSDDIPQGIITIYHVIVQNKDSYVLLNINTTDTFYNSGFSSNLTVCDIYTATVTVFIQQYTSISVSSTKEYTESWLITYYQILWLYSNIDYTVKIQNYTVIFYETENDFATLFKIKVLTVFYFDNKFIWKQIVILCKVNGTPRLCNSLLFGTTEYNNIVTTYHLQYIGNTTNNDDVIICYNITGLDPFNNYNFTVYITDSFNNSKDQNRITISELKNTLHYCI